MIDVKLNFDSRRGTIRLRLRGHAGSAPRGEDLVCAAASALALTAGECATLLHSRGLLTRPPMVRLNRGDALVIATPKRETLAEVLLCFWTVQAGLYALQQQYPQYVSLAEVLQV